MLGVKEKGRNEGRNEMTVLILMGVVVGVVIYLHKHNVLSYAREIELAEHDMLLYAHTFGRCQRQSVPDARLRKAVLSLIASRSFSKDGLLQALDSLKGLSSDQRLYCEQLKQELQGCDKITSSLLDHGIEGLSSLYQSTGFKQQQARLKAYITVYRGYWETALS